MTRRAPIHSLVIAWALAAVLAQDKPDFSGRWVLESPAQPGADVPRTMSVALSVRRTNVRGEPMTPYFSDIEIRGEFETGARTESRAIGIIGGTVSGLSRAGTSNGADTRYGVKWEGNDLVFENGSSSGRTADTGTWSERREVWSLDATGRLRVLIMTRGSDHAPTNVTLVYRREH
jgi:hypothetical protein